MVVAHTVLGHPPGPVIYKLKLLLFFGKTQIDYFFRQLHPSANKMAFARSLRSGGSVDLEPRARLRPEQTSPCFTRPGTEPTVVPPPLSLEALEEDVLACILSK